MTRTRTTFRIVSNLMDSGVRFAQGALRKKLARVVSARELGKSAAPIPPDGAPVGRVSPSRLFEKADEARLRTRAASHSWTRASVDLAYIVEKSARSRRRTSPRVRSARVASVTQGRSSVVFSIAGQIPGWRAALLAGPTR